MTLTYMLTDLVEDERILRLFMVEKLVIFHPIKHIFIFICRFDILIVESSTDTNFQDKFSVRVIIHEPYFRVQALSTDIHAQESVSDFLRQRGNLPQDVVVKTVITAPFLLRDEWSTNEDSLSIITVPLLLFLATLRLLLLISLPVLKIGMELVDPLLVDLEKHNRV